MCARSATRPCGGSPPAEREGQRRGPKLAAVLTLVVLGVVVIFAAVAMTMAWGRVSRGTFYMAGFGVTLIGAGVATWRDL